MKTKGISYTNLAIQHPHMTYVFSMINCAIWAAGAVNTYCDIAGAAFRAAFSILLTPTAIGGTLRFTPTRNDCVGIRQIQ